MPNECWSPASWRGKPVEQVPVYADKSALAEVESQRSLPRAIALDGYQASHRAAREFLATHRRGYRTKIRSSKYLNNLIEQDHRSIKLRLGPMLGFKRFRNASITIAGIELVHRIRKGQFALKRLRVRGKTAPEIWTAVLAA